MSANPIRIGISQCLLGDPVRYDGGHKRDAYLVDVLGRRVEWVPVCPEVEAGFGVPREPMQLVGHAMSPRLVTIRTQRDLTKQLNECSARKVRELRKLDLSGYVFKARSPSCGLDQVPLSGRHGQVRPEGVGLFARAFQKAFPRIPITDEARLGDPAARERFLAQVSEYHCRKMLAKIAGPAARSYSRARPAQITRMRHKP